VVQEACACCLRCMREAIDPRERRFVDKNRTTKIERHRACELLTEQMRKGGGSPERPPFNLRTIRCTIRCHVRFTPSSTARWISRAIVAGRRCR